MTAPDPRPLAARLWDYQRERFPLLAHGALVAAFSGGVACAAAALAREPGPGWGPALVAIGVAFGVFFQLRVADEWKDAEADAALQPDRPVPRGLVTLRELTLVALAVALVQGLATWGLAPSLVGPLGLVWAFGALMTVEFGASRWLRERPVAVLVSHSFIVPLIDWFAISSVVLAAGLAYPKGVGWLVGVSWFGGMTVEIVRKIKPRVDEIAGVDTYSALWGRRRALAVWAAILTLSGVCGARVLLAEGVPGLAWGLAAGAALALAVAASSLRSDAPGAGRRVETAAGLWTLALYLTIGPGALLAQRLALASRERRSLTA